MLLICLSIFILIILLYYCNYNIENLSFTTKYLLDKYDRSNIKIDINKKTLQKDNVLVSYKNHFNTLESIKICNDKSKTLEILKKNKIPVTNFVLWDNEKTEYENKRVLII